MAASQMNEVLEHLRRAVLPRDSSALTDGQLLEDYLSGRDEAALAALVQRHGPMVWGVCRRVVGDHHDAEDAFQATFLVFTRKAGSIAARELVANYLYKVAYQTALKARATAVRRKAREKQVIEMPEPEMAVQELWHDLQPLLDKELSRLPDKYRAPIVLCDLEGKSRKEAAGQLGCPEGTVAGRLARARAILAKRLGRRGLAVSGGSLGAVLSQSAAPACVPAKLLSATIQAASQFSAHQALQASTIGVKVSALTEGMLRTLYVNKLKKALAAVALLVVAILAAGEMLLRINGNRAVDPDLNKPDALAPASMIVVNASYPGANAKTVADTVAHSLEKRFADVSDLARMESESTQDGDYRARLYFAPGTDLTVAEKVVKQHVALLSQRDYSKRLWLDPEKMTNGKLSAIDVIDDASRQNAQIAAGQIGQPPSPRGQPFPFTIHWPTLPAIVVNEGVSVNIARVEDEREKVTIVVIDQAEIGWQALETVSTVVVKKLSAEGGITELRTFPPEEPQFEIRLDQERCKAYGLLTEDHLKMVDSIVANQKATRRRVTIDKSSITRLHELELTPIANGPPGRMAESIQIIDADFLQRIIDQNPFFGRKSTDKAGKEIRELGDLVVQDSRNVHLRDIADIEAFLVPKAIYRINGYPAIRITGLPARGKSPSAADVYVQLAKDALQEFKATQPELILTDGFKIQDITSK